jgi:hypothetical protein
VASSAAVAIREQDTRAPAPWRERDPAAHPLLAEAAFSCTPPRCWTT